MKAAVLHEYGPPSKLKYEDFPDPKPEWHRHQLLRLIDGEIQQLHAESAVAA